MVTCLAISIVTAIPDVAAPTQQARDRQSLAASVSPVRRTGERKAPQDAPRQAAGATCEAVSTTTRRETRRSPIAGPAPRRAERSAAYAESLRRSTTKAPLAGSDDSSLAIGMSPKQWPGARGSAVESDRRPMAAFRAGRVCWWQREDAGRASRPEVARFSE